MKNNKFSISADLLGIVSFLANKTNAWYFRELHDTIKPEDIEKFLVSIAIDCLKPSQRKMLDEYASGKKVLNKTEERMFRDLGFLYGKTPKLPKQVIEYYSYLNKYL